MGRQVGPDNLLLLLLGASSPLADNSWVSESDLESKQKIGGRDKFLPFLMLLLIHTSDTYVL